MFEHVMAKGTLIDILRSSKGTLIDKPKWAKVTTTEQKPLYKYDLRGMIVVGLLGIFTGRIARTTFSNVRFTYDALFMPMN